MFNSTTERCKMFNLEIIEVVSGKIIESFDYESLQDAQDEMDRWDCNEYEFNLIKAA